MTKQRYPRLVPVFDKSGYRIHVNPVELDNYLRAGWSRSLPEKATGANEPQIEPNTAQYED